MKRVWSDTVAAVNKKQHVETSIPLLRGISEKIHDRSSTFQAFFAPLTSTHEISVLMDVFRSSCDHVDHVMTAYRFRDDEIGYEKGFDDDGERFSGKRLLDLLDTMDMTGFIICTRIYGGIMLGPIRFQHIIQCARDAIMVYRRQRSIDTAEIQKLNRLLSARDKTIVLLRAMLTEQQSTSTETMVASQGSQSGIETEKSTGQDVAKLRRLLFARDSTIRSLRTNLAILKDGKQEVSPATGSTG